jgi:hypothetical protein
LESDFSWIENIFSSYIIVFDYRENLRTPYWWTLFFQFLKYDPKKALGAKGLRARHWDQIEEIVGTDIRPDDDTSLLQMLEYNLSDKINKLSEVSASAAKEYALERSLEKMQEDWAEMDFALLQYRDTVLFKIN